MADAGSDMAIEPYRAFVIQPDDHRGVLMCIAVLFIGYALMIIGMRILARVRTMGIDDYLAMLATFGIVIAGVSHYLGASFSKYHDGDAIFVARMLRASDIILIISLFIAKTAVIWLCRRLFSINQKAPRIFCDIVLGISGLWCIGSVLAITLHCDQQAAIGLGNGKCSDLIRRWTLVGIVDGVIELMIFGLAVTVVWPLRMSLSRRLSAMSCFIVRLPIVVFIALHVFHLSRSVHKTNRGVALVQPVIYRQSELLYSLFSAAVPALNQYLRKFTVMGHGTFGYSDGSHGNAYGLKSLTQKGLRSTDERERGHIGFVPPAKDMYSATIDYRNHKTRSNSPADGFSLERHGSDELIIRKDVQYEVTFSENEQDSLRRR